jgi:hypothetical protein
MTEMLSLSKRCPIYKGKIEWQLPTWDWRLVSLQGDLVNGEGYGMYG